MAKKSEEIQSGAATAAAAMVPTHPAAERQARPAGKQALRPVEALAAKAGVADWELSALRRAAGWAPGRQVDPQVFANALTALRKRPMGGGRLKQ